MDKDYLILKRASASRPSGEWNDDDYDVLATGTVVGRIFEGTRGARRDAVDVDIGLRAARGPHADARLRRNARGGHDGVREELEAGAAMTFEILTVIVLVNLGLTIELWRRAARRPEKLKRKFRNRLWRSKPIIPKHEPPPPLDEKRYGVGKRTLQFFSDFEDFGDVVNARLADPHVHPHNSPWRLQELPKSELLALDIGEPTYGRTYAVFHNQVRVGEIEIKPDWNYSSQNPRVTVHIELDWVRALPFGTIRGFLIDIAQYVSEYHLEHLQINQRIDLALMGVLWETQEISQYGLEPSYGQVEVELDGLASLYLRRRQYLRDEADKAKQQT